MGVTARRSTPAGFSRRRFIVAGLATAAMTLAPGRTARSQDEALQTCLASLVRDGESYRRVGLLYRRSNPAAADIGELRRQLGEPAGREPLFLLGLSPAARRRWFVDRCRRDFEQGKVEPFGGWLFAASELRLAALLAA